MCIRDSLVSGQTAIAGKGEDLLQVSNWRPIVILPILYKIFARLLYNRIALGLFVYQSLDQHTFTSNARIEDALLYAEVSSQ